MRWGVDEIGICVHRVAVIMDRLLLNESKRRCFRHRTREIRRDHEVGSAAAA